MRGKIYTVPPKRKGEKYCSGDFSEVQACAKTNCPPSSEYKLKKALNPLRLEILFSLRAKDSKN